MTGRMTTGENLAAALNESPPGSSVTAINKGELFSSFDVDAFEVPGGRDEIWRFTPLRRLRGLHDGSAPATGAGRHARLTALTSACSEAVVMLGEIPQPHSTRPATATSR